ncbi:MAG: TrpR YerC/YecD [Sphaerochaetaceae bacterium]|nr:TrpR YerC/YecD [Sphaerochaetaceae bacterium]
MAKPQRTEPQMELYKAILNLKTPEECMSFFEDLCSDTEIASMEQRFCVAKMLMEKTVYTEILSKTGAGTATISRVNRVISKGNGTLIKAIESIK